MKKNLLIGILLILGFALPVYSATILLGTGGGTGFATTTLANVGNCLSVSDDSPLTYTFSGCSGGTGGNTSKWATTTDITVITPNSGGTIGIIVNASSTLRQLNFTLATGTSATTTNFFSTLASTTNFYSQSLFTCDSTSGKLTWANGNFGCGTDFNTGGSGGSNWSFSTLTAITPSTTPISLIVGHASSSFVGLNIVNSTTTNSTSTTDFVTFLTTTSATSTNLFATLASSTNLFSTNARFTNVGIATSTATFPLSVNGNAYFNSQFAHFGTSSSNVANCNAGAFASGACVELIGNDNTGGGVLFLAQNRYAGANAFVGTQYVNDLWRDDGVQYAGLYLNSSAYTNTAFGSAQAIPNQLALVNTMGELTLISGTSTSAGLIRFVVNGLTTAGEVGRFTNNERFGVGTTTPGAKLSVHLNPTDTFSPYSFMVSSSTNSATTTFFSINNTGNITQGSINGKNLVLSDTDAASNQKNWMITSWDGVFGVSSTTDAGATTSPPAFLINPVGVGVFLGATTSNVAVTGLAVAGTQFWSGLTVSTAGNAVCKLASGEIVDAGANTCLTSSKRFKTNIKDLNNSLDTVLSMTPRSFDRKIPSPSHLSGKEVGFIAEEVNLIDPRLVEYEPDGVTPRAVNYQAYTAYLTGAIQELNKKVDSKQGTTANRNVYILGILFLLYVIYNEIWKRRRK